MPKRLISALLALSLLSACTVIGELAYDNKLDRDREACKLALDNSAYRSCMDRVRALEAQANSVRKSK